MSDNPSTDATFAILQGEKLFPLPEAYERATGVRPHPSTCHRHRINGCHGIRLSTIKNGGKRMTSVEAVHRFNEAVTLAADGESVAPQARTPRQRQSDVDRAEIKLAAEGI